MKKNSILWAALSMTAALVMTACSSDNDVTETPQAPSTSKTIPYTVTVGGDEATTRATVDGDNKTLRFATGDKLYITGTDIQGVLNITDGVGAYSNATFSGVLTYSGEGSPADNLQLTATLVSAQQLASLPTANPLVTVNAAGAVTVNYPASAYCTSINDAVQEYSRLTGTCEYSQKAFTLTQQTAFLNFEITFEDGTATSTSLSAKVNNNSSNICTANVTTTTESTKVVAKFVLPVAASTTLSSANVKMGSKEAISFGASQKLTGKVYNVKKTQYKMAAAATSADKGKLICADGHIHAYGADAACTKDRVAKIVYVGSDNGEAAPYNHGLALAMSDANGGNSCAWKTSRTDAGHTWQTNSNNFTSESGLQYNAMHNSEIDNYPAFKAAIANNSTAAPTGCSAWFLASGYQWTKMFAGDAGGLITLAGLESSSYWSSSEGGVENAWLFSAYATLYGVWGFEFKENDIYLVRSCLAF